MLIELLCAVLASSLLWLYMSIITFLSGRTKAKANQASKDASK